MKRLLIDYETQADADLKKTGAVKYAKDKNTFAMCMGYKFDDEPSQLWVAGRDEFPKRVFKAFTDESIKLVAHNAFFEQLITEFVLPRHGVATPYIPVSRWRCTAAKAAACALPRSLEGAGTALKLKIQKNKDGHKLMLKYCKPRPTWKKWKKQIDACDNEIERFNLTLLEPKKYYDDWFELEALYDYCVTDVDAEALLDDYLPNLSDYEQRVWEKNQEMNLRGIQIDIETVKHILEMYDKNVGVMQERAYDLTDGEVDSILKRDVVLKWLKRQGLEYSNLKKATVLSAIEDDTLPADVKELMEIRAAVSKTSIKKYKAMLERADDDGRVRDLSLYHGASTGRESGRGLQPHNFPRGKIKNTGLAIDVIKNCISYDDVAMYYTDPMEAFSSCLRGMIIPTPGKILTVGDFNAIECRVLNWIAGQYDVLEDFRQGGSPYKRTASRIFGVPIEDIDRDYPNDDGPQRFLGKTAELGCGYQMGKDRFYTTCIEWGVPNVSESLAERAVKVYRESHPRVVDLWYLVERAAIKAVLNPLQKITVEANPDAPVVFIFKAPFLWCVLPSGRRLCFPFANVRNEENRFGVMQAKLYYYRTNPMTRQWQETATYGGSLTESICQGTARDITVNGINKAEESEYSYLFQVHDEVICETNENDCDKHHYLNCLTDVPDWAETLPTKAGGWTGYRYRK